MQEDKNSNFSFMNQYICIGIQIQRFVFVNFNYGFKLIYQHLFRHLTNYFSISKKKKNKEINKNPCSALMNIKL